MESPRIIFRVEPEKKEKMDKIAESLDISVSELIRRSLNYYIPIILITTNSKNQSQHPEPENMIFKSFCCPDCGKVTSLSAGAA